MEAHHHVRDLTFREDAAASRTGSGPVNLATIRAAIIAALKDAGYLHIPESRRDHTPIREFSSLCARICALNQAVELACVSVPADGADGIRGQSGADRALLAPGITGYRAHRLRP